MISKISFMKKKLVYSNDKTRVMRNRLKTAITRFVTLRVLYLHVYRKRKKN